MIPPMQFRMSPGVRPDRIRRAGAGSWYNVRRCVRPASEQPFDSPARRSLLARRGRRRAGAAGARRRRGLGGGPRGPSGEDSRRGGAADRRRARRCSVADRDVVRGVPAKRARLRRARPGAHSGRLPLRRAQHLRRGALRRQRPGADPRPQAAAPRRAPDRRPHPARVRHLPRPDPGHRVRGQPVGSEGGGPHQRVPALHLELERGVGGPCADHRHGLAGRAPDPAAGVALRLRDRADLGCQPQAGGAAPPGGELPRAAAAAVRHLEPQLRGPPAGPRARDPAAQPAADPVRARRRHARGAARRRRGARRIDHRGGARPQVLTHHRSDDERDVQHRLLPGRG